MKTATIECGHVFGTKATNFVEVLYRGKRVFFHMENENVNNLCAVAVEWAKQNGFTHFKTSIVC